MFYLEACLNKNGTKAEQEQGNLQIKIPFAKCFERQTPKQEIKPKFEVVKIKRRTIKK